MEGVGSRVKNGGCKFKREERSVIIENCLRVQSLYFGN